jgi:hypothetical protein
MPITQKAHDPNQLAKLRLDIVTGEVPDPVSEKKKNPSKRRIGGEKGARPALHLSVRKKEKQSLKKRFGL